MLPAVTAGDLEALDQFTAVQQDQLTRILAEAEAAEEVGEGALKETQEFCRLKDLVSFIGSAFCTEGLIFLGGKLSHTDYQLKQHEENHTWGWSSLQNLIHVECEFSA